MFKVIRRKKKVFVGTGIATFLCILFFSSLTKKQFAVPIGPGGPGGQQTNITKCDSPDAGPPNNSYSQYDTSGQNKIPNTTTYCANYQYCSDSNGAPQCIPTGCSCDPNNQFQYQCFFGGSSQGGGYSVTNTCRQSDICPSTFKNLTGYPCIPAGSTNTSPPPPGGTVGNPTPPGGTPGDPCAATLCGDGFYCGGECGAGGQAGTRYLCRNQSLVSLENCGCQYCPIAADICTNGSTKQSCQSNACENVGGQCYSGKQCPNVDVNNNPLSPIADAVCIDSQLNPRPNTVCCGSAQASNFGKPCTSTTSVGSICRPIIGNQKPVDACSVFGEDVDKSASGTQNCGVQSNYACCVPKQGYGYNTKTACVSPSSAGMCKKVDKCPDGTDQVDANVDAASCYGSGLSASDFQQPGSVKCCVPNTGSHPGGPVTYACSPYDNTEYLDSAGVHAGNCPKGQVCDPNVIVNPPCGKGTTGQTNYLSIQPSSLDLSTCSNSACSLTISLSSSAQTPQTYVVSVSPAVITLSQSTFTLQPGKSLSISFSVPAGVSCPSGGITITIQSSQETHTVTVKCPTINTGGTCNDGTIKGSCTQGGQCGTGFEIPDQAITTCNYGYTCCLPGDIGVACQDGNQSGRCQAITANGGCPTGQYDALGVDSKGNACNTYGSRYTCCIGASKNIPPQPPVSVRIKPHNTCENTGGNGYKKSDTLQHAGYCAVWQDCKNVTDPNDPNITDLAECISKRCNYPGDINYPAGSGYCATYDPNDPNYQSTLCGGDKKISAPDPGDCGYTAKNTPQGSGYTNVCCIGQQNPTSNFP